MTKQQWQAPRPRVAVYGIVGLLLAACASTPIGEGTREASERALEREPAQEKAPEAGDTAEAPAPDAPKAERKTPKPKPEPEPRFDVQVRDVPARAFFEALVADTPYNIAIADDVEGRISLQLSDVTVEETLDVVRRLYGYDIRPMAAGYIVRPPGLRSRIFEVDYLSMSREGDSRTRVASGQIADARERDADSGSRRRDQEQTPGTEIRTSTQSDLWEDIETSLKAIVGEADGRRVIVNPMAGSVVVRATHEELEEIADYLDQLHDTVSRQVVLEAKILEVELRDEFEAGINWSAVFSGSEGTALIGQRGGPNVFDQGFAPGRGRNRVTQPGNQPEGFDFQEIGGVFAMAMDLGGDFNAFVELLETQGETRVLSSPRVSTINNQKAVIKVGRDEFFVTGISTGSSVGLSSTVQQRDIELTPLFSGIALDVTPQISSSGEVILHIHPTVSEVTDQRKELVIAGEEESLPLATSDVREADNIVRARSGQTIVIGGLMRTQMRDNEFRVPWLGSLPLVGNLFRQTRQEEVKTELVILMRPQVVDRDGLWDDMTRDTRRRIDEMQSQPGGLRRQ